MIPEPTAADLACDAILDYKLLETADRADMPVGVDVGRPWIRRAVAAEAKLAALAAVPCRCEPAFTSRDRHASDCFWNELRSNVDLEELK